MPSFAARPARPQKLLFDSASENRSLNRGDRSTIYVIVLRSVNHHFFPGNMAASDTSIYTISYSPRMVSSSAI